MRPRHLWSFIYRSRDYYAWLRERFGRMVTLRAPHATIVMTLTSQAAREVLTGSPSEYGAFQQEAFRGLAGNGSLFVLDGERHQRERQLLAPSFHAQHIRRYGQAIQENARFHTNTWRPGQKIRAHQAVLDITREVILDVVFGDQENGFRAEGRRVLRETLSAAYPLLEYLPPFQSWWFPPWRRFKRARREFYNYVARVLANHRKGDNKSEDVLNLLLGTRRNDSTVLTDEEIRDELYTILLPGHATTAVALAWALYELGRHPELLRRLREELEALGPNPDPFLIVRQPFLGAVCNETMRVIPS